MFLLVQRQQLIKADHLIERRKKSTTTTTAFNAGFQILVLEPELTSSSY
ncbi:hypothetical protein DERF_008088 [Dermatophagoides farinae]|uniref:Uncharacterized protein n=1 Tax=Dermatophagoides farinae TaxID=6954 RepID=A0A922I2G6_DERFA|nr:hypothetical protein DERF_008088 [Dermatophagoides farinae]